jgi:hypothetical protein
VPYSDAKYLGVKRPFEEMRRYGDVACLVRNNPDQTYVESCVRTSDELTVQISHVSGDLDKDPKAVAGLVTVAWDDLA